MSGRLPVVPLAVVLVAAFPPSHAASEVDPWPADRYPGDASDQKTEEVVDTGRLPEIPRMAVPQAQNAHAR